MEEYKKYIRYLLWVLALGAIIFIFVIQDWNWYRLKIAMRLKFTQIFNIAMLWIPILLFDLSTSGKTLDSISTPENSTEKLAASLFYGIMGIATALCVVWGN